MVGGWGKAQYLGVGAATKENDRRRADLFDFSGRPLTHVLPGQVVVSAEPQSYITILGSCVSVCVHDPVTRLGGLNHYLLPDHTRVGESTRFGEGAIRTLIEEMLARGAAKGRIQAKVFGGARLLGIGSSGRHIGSENVNLAFAMLAEAGIPVIAEDVSGVRGRKVIFHADTGNTWVRRL